MGNTEVEKTKAQLLNDVIKTKKQEVKEALIEASKQAKKVYDANKDKVNPLTGQLGINERKLIGKAKEAVRSASSSTGGGQFVTLSDEAFRKIVEKYFPEYYN
jgi:sugar-specific transcriptional regulator TrmB